MSMIEEKVIKLSKGKTASLTATSLGFVLVGIFLLMIKQKGVFITTAAYTSIIFFGLTGFIGIKKLKDDSPGLTLNQDGFIDNSSGISAGFVPWSDVLKIEEYQVQGQRFVSVKVNDPDRYIETGNSVQRMLKRASLKMCGAPINISSNCLKINHHDLLEAFNIYFHYSKQK